MALPQSAWNELSAVTQRHFITPMVQQIFDSTFLLKKMLGGAHKASGGRVIQTHLMYGTARGGEYEFYDEMDSTHVDDITVAEFDWKQYFEPISISGREEEINSGKEAMLNLIKAKVEKAELGIREILSNHLFGTNAGASKRIEGLQDAVYTDGDATPECNNTYGGLDRNTLSWWKNNVAVPVTGLNDQITDDDMVQMLNACAFGEERPDCIVGTRETVGRIELELLVGDERYVNANNANRGFETFRYHGIPVSADPHCTAGYLYFLNTKYLKFTVHKNRNFKFRPFQIQQGQDATAAYILFMGNLCLSRSLSQGVISGIKETYSAPGG